MSFAQKRSPSPPPGCRENFLKTLRHFDPDGFSIWDALSESDKNQIAHLLICEANGDISGVQAGTLVHEALHLLNHEKSSIGSWSFLLLNGQRITLSSSPSDQTYEHSRGQALRVMTKDERRFSRVRIYLYEDGDQSLTSLLEELDAYSTGLRTAVRFPKTEARQTPLGVVKSFSADEREGPLEMILFTLRYLEAMKKHDREYFEKSIERHEELLFATRSLIRDAFDAINSSCDREDLSINDGPILDALHKKNSQEILQFLFGKSAPEISRRCQEIRKDGPLTHRSVSQEHPRKKK